MDKSAALESLIDVPGQTWGQLSVAVKELKGFMVGRFWGEMCVCVVECRCALRSLNLPAHP